MLNNSTTGQDRPLKNGTDLDENELNERLNWFSSGETKPTRQWGGLDPDEKRDQIQSDLEAIDALDDLLSDDTDDTVTAHFVAAAVDATSDDDVLEVIRDTPETRTPYERAFQRVRELEAQRAEATPGSDEHRALSGLLAEAKRKLKIEDKRGLDEGWRQRRGTDEWRRGEGQDEYNASRRTVRTVPNRMTPKAELAAMSPEERKQHDKDREADRKYIRRTRTALKAKGLSEAEIQAEVEAGLAKLHTKRIARRAK